MIQPDYNILNQRGTPMFFSDVFANRPTAGIVGRIFISTDTKEFYRDTGSSWELLGGPGAGTITGSGTTGRLSKFTSSSSIGDSIVTEGTSLINITGSNSRFVVGGIDDGSSQLQTYYDGNTRWKFVSASNNATDDADITGYKSRGTIASPLAIQSGDAITNYSGRGYNGTSFVGGGGFDIFAAENYSVGANGTYIAIETTPIGSATPSYFHRFSANGGLHVGQNSDPTIGYKFQVTGNSFISGRMDVNNSTADNQIRVSGSSSPSIRLDNALTAPTQRFAIGLSTATNNFIQGSTAGDICITTASASPMLFGMWQTINASEVMRISTSNNLIVGSITDNGNRFQVTGNGYFSGSVGIGVVTPLFKLHVQGSDIGGVFDGTSSSGSGFVSSYNSNSGNAIQVRSYGNTTGQTIFGLSTNKLNTIWSNGDNFFAVGTISSTPLVFGTNNSERMRITSGGDVAIGTTSASSAISGSARVLAIVDNATANVGSVRVYGGGTATSIELFGGASLVGLWGSTNHPMAFATSNTERMMITSVGNLLVGTSVDSGQRLQVNGAGYFTSGLTSSTSFSFFAHYFYNGGGSNDIFASTNGNGAGSGNFAIVNTVNTANTAILGSINGFFRIGTSGQTAASADRFIVNLNNGATTFNGAIRVNGQTAATAGGSSGQHLIINCDGTTYKIALLNN